MDKAQEVLESPLREQLWNSPDASGFSRADTNKKRLGKPKKFFESEEGIKVTMLSCAFEKAPDGFNTSQSSLLTLKDSRVSRPNNKLN